MKILNMIHGDLPPSIDIHLMPPGGENNEWQEGKYKYEIKLHCPDKTIYELSDTLELKYYKERKNIK